MAEFITIGSSAGKIEIWIWFLCPMSVYGTTKAALDYVIKKIHQENEDIITFLATWVGSDRQRKPCTRLWGFERLQLLSKRA